MSKNLHRETLKQSAMAPKTGMININILTAWLSIYDLKGRIEVSRALMRSERKDNHPMPCSV
jgi:hypothetical protein